MFGLKKFKKNCNGMTLVEVVVAMAYFSSCMLGVTMALSAALKYTVRNQKRDAELNVQQTAIEKNTTAGVALVSGTTLNQYTIKFTSSKISKEKNNITEYKAIKTASSGDDYNFEIKSLSSTPLGCATTTANKSDKQYLIYVVNNSSYTVDVKIELNKGIIYEGDYSSGYRHSSNVYLRSLKALSSSSEELIKDAGESALPDRFVIGYYDKSDALSGTDSVMKITVTVNGTSYPYDVKNSEMKKGKLNVVIDGSGSVLEPTGEETS